MGHSTASISFVRGDDGVLRATVKNNDGTAYDLTGATIRYVLKTLATDADGVALILKDITTTLTVDGQILAPATAGILDFFIEDDDTLGRTPPPTDLSLEEDDVLYWHGVKEKSAAGLYHTLAKGQTGLEREIVDNF